LHYYPDRIIAYLKGGGTMTIFPQYPDGTKLGLDHFRNAFFPVHFDELVINKCEDN